MYPEKFKRSDNVSVVNNQGLNGNFVFPERNNNLFFLHNVEFQIVWRTLLEKFLHLITVITFSYIMLYIVFSPVIQW